MQELGDGPRLPAGTGILRQPPLETRSVLLKKKRKKNLINKNLRLFRGSLSIH